MTFCFILFAINETASAYYHAQLSQPPQRIDRQLAAQQRCVVESPQGRFLSDGDVLRKDNNEVSYAAGPNNTVRNIRELTGSPQRGIYMWKDISPGMNAGPTNNCMEAAAINKSALETHSMASVHARYVEKKPYQHEGEFQFNYKSNPTSPTNILSSTTATTTSNCTGPYACNNVSNPSIVSVANHMPHGYQPQLRGGVPVFPPSVLASCSTAQTTQTTAGGPATIVSPLIKRKHTPTRPMSFVRALEMTDSMEMRKLDQQQREDSITNIVVAPKQAVASNNDNVARDRASVYDMNYEISV